MVRDALNFDDGTIVFNEKTALEGIDTLEFTILFHHEHLNLLGIEIGSFEESIKLLPFIEKGDVLSNFRLKSKITGNTFQVNKWLGKFTRLSGDFSDARSGNEYRDLKRRCDGYRVLIEKLIDRNAIATNGYDENTALEVVRENELKRSCPVTAAGRCTKYYFNFTCQVGLINLEDQFTFFEEAYYFDGMSCPEAQARFRAYVSQTKKADIFWQYANDREPETYKLSRKLRRKLGIKEKYGCRVVVNSIKPLY